MKKLLSSSATFLAFCGIVSLTWIGLQKDTNVAMEIAMIAMGLAGSRAYEGSKVK